MKKIFIVICLCAGFHFAQAQEPQTAEAFTTYSANMDGRLSAAAKAKDNPQVLKLMSEWLTSYGEQPKVIQDQFKSHLPDLYYDVACYQALDARPDLAVASFQKAVNAGYANYAQALKDNDLNTLRKDKRFKAALAQLRLKSDYGFILKTSGKYHPEAYPAILFPFTYQPSSAPELVELRTKFNLDSISGHADEISRIKNLLYWVHNLIRHDGNSGNPPSKNALDLIAVCQKENRGVNCRMLATILRDAYQAEGFQARIITCLPKDTTDFDCHVINVVWAKSLHKWIWMDPTNNAYICDEKGNLLGIEEVRERLISGEPLVLNTNANWNNKQKQTKESDLDTYMSKNLYWLRCSVKSEWDLETKRDTKPALTYVNLYPGTYSTIGGQAKQVSKNQVIYATGNPDYFWQKP